MENSVAGWRGAAVRRLETLLDEIRGDWSAEVDGRVRAAEGKAAREGAETSNAALRRMRQMESLDALGSALVELTAPFAETAALFVFAEGRGRALAARALGELPLEMEPGDGAAFRTAIETRDPVLAMAVPSEISATVANRLPSREDARAVLIPLTAHGEVRAVLFGTGETLRVADLELLAGMTALRMEALTPAPAVSAKPEKLVMIDGAQRNTAASDTPQDLGRKAWTDLTPEQQSAHLRAQRAARLSVAQMRLEHGAALRGGLLRSDIYSALRAPIDAARQTFRQDYVAGSPTMVDYLYLEIVRSFAGNDERLLGPNFPGPLA